MTLKRKPYYQQLFLAVYYPYLSSVKTLHCKTLLLCLIYTDLGVHSEVSRNMLAVLRMPRYHHLTIVALLGAGEYVEVFRDWQITARIADIIFLLEIGD